eukprot:m.495549 g.495549  ORF g.495549 m.495549 type:complete len:57 (-) comp44786_c0_seq1:49-219(-)
MGESMLDRYQPAVQIIQRLARLQRVFDEHAEPQQRKGNTSSADSNVTDCNASRSET